jgi:cytochrome c oxidase assembly protein subunit 15
MRSDRPKILPNGAATRNPWLHRFAFFTASCCFILLFMGGLVTSHQAGLSVPDWPTSFGWNMFTFPMKDWQGGIFYEHTHRLFASFVGSLIVLQAILFQYLEPRAWVRKLGWLAVGGVVCQGILGGITVLTYLPPAVSSAHAGLGQAEFCLTLALTLVTSLRWNDSQEKRYERRRIGVRTLSLASVVVIFLQLMIGAFMRHTNIDVMVDGTMRHVSAGLAIPTFPDNFGRLIPEFSNIGIVLNFAHRAWALVVTIMILWTTTVILRNYANIKPLRRPANLIVFLLGVQIMLGGITILSQKAVTPTTLHVICGAAILGTMVVIMIRSRHYFLAPESKAVRATPYEPVQASIVSEA